jgi:signal recognition particle receptor subunit beta
VQNISLTPYQEIYRIGITGHFPTGITAFIRSISEKPVVTIPFDVGAHKGISFHVGQLVIDQKHTLQLLGNPSNYPPLNMLRIVNPKLFGLIVMVNTALPEQFREAASIIAVLTAYQPIPFVVVCNPLIYVDFDAETKQFTKPVEGLNPEDLRTVLRMGDKDALIMCNAEDRDSTKQALIALLERTANDANIEKLISTLKT